MARYDWIDDKGAWIPDATTDADCKSLRASWANEALPKRIARCFETPRESPVSRPAKPVESEVLVLNPKKAFAFARYAPRSRTLGPREEANIYADEMEPNGEAMRYSRDAMPATESFFHKRLISAATGFLGGGPVGAITGLISGGGGNGPRKHRELREARATMPSNLTVPSGMPCVWPARIDPVTGLCKIFAGEIPGPDVGGVPSVANGGRPVVGPGARSITRLTCPKGYILNIQNMCEWGLARNAKARKWRPGRKPLFTGGDLNAISKAASLGSAAEEIFKKTNPAKKAVSRSYRSGWRKPLKK